MSLRRVRSPEAPKMISANGSSADGMAPEGPAERGEQPVREGVLPARAEAGVERRGDGGRGDRLRDRVLDGPPALAGVLHPRLEAGERRVGAERVGGQLEEPGADHAAPVPEVRDAGPGG